MAVKLTYNKPQIPVSEQIRLLKSEGLTFADEERAIHLLENISLFRMKSYLVPLRQSDKRTFKSGALFEDAYTLYKFDSELRKMIFSELEQIRQCIEQIRKEVVDKMSLTRPFSFVLLNDEHETMGDIYLVDDDEVIVPTRLLEGLDEDLNDFLDKLMS